MNLDKIEIIKAADTDIEKLQNISKLTFFETFGEANTRENMEQYLEEEFNLDKLAFEINNPDSEFFLAFFNDQVIGYLKINFGNAQTELKNKKTIEIERIYLLKEFHGKKIGQLFYNKTLHIAQYKNADYIWLGVWEKNSRAINFYKKNGFIEFDRHIFKLGNDKQTDIMMKLDLKV